MLSDKALFGCWCYVNADDACPVALVSGKCPLSIYVPWTTQKRGDVCTGHQMLLGEERELRGAWHCRPGDFSPTYDGAPGAACEGTDANGAAASGTLWCLTAAK